MNKPKRLFEQKSNSNLRLEEESASGKLKGSATSGPHVHTYEFGASIVDSLNKQET